MITTFVTFFRDRSVEDAGNVHRHENSLTYFNVPPGAVRTDRDLERALDAGGVSVTLSGDDAHVITVRVVPGRDTQPPSKGLLLSTWGCDWTPLDTPTAIDAFQHLLVPVNDTAQTRLQNFVKHLGWLTNDQATAVLTALRAPTLEARVSLLEQQAAASQAPGARAGRAIAPKWGAAAAGVLLVAGATGTWLGRDHIAGWWGERTGVVTGVTPPAPAEVPVTASPATPTTAGPAPTGSGTAATPVVPPPMASAPASQPAAPAPASWTPAAPSAKVVAPPKAPLEPSVAKAVDGVFEAARARGAPYATHIASTKPALAMSSDERVASLVRLILQLENGAVPEPEQLAASVPDYVRRYRTKLGRYPTLMASELCRMGREDVTDQKWPACPPEPRALMQEITDLRGRLTPPSSANR